MIPSPIPGLFAPYSAECRTRAENIRLMVLDADGVLTSGQLFIGSGGEIIKAFNTLDGHGIKMLQQSGVQAAIITARHDAAVAHRAGQLGIRHYFCGVSDKKVAFSELCKQTGVSAAQCAMVGDDIIDLPVMLRCGLPVAVANAHALVKQHALYTTQKSGGFGAVRETCDMLMHAQGTLDAAWQEYTR